MKQKVALGLSGGVDSAVSAALLMEQGYEVTGVFVECYNAPGCRTDEDHKDALDIALQLKIPFEVLDFKQAYQEKVLDYFVREYKAGRTPNPDVVCNREIKFGLFYKSMIDRGFDYVATGHYAQIQRFMIHDLRFKNKAQYLLLKGKDEKKDQSYFLHLLIAEQLEHILFPIGHMTKQEVREEANKRGLVVADKPDSQGICFIGEVPAHKFLKEMGVEEKPGEVVDGAGNVIGTHKGVWFYTIGQRKGFTSHATRFTNNAERPPMFVIGKDIEGNRLIVGTREQAMRQEFEVEGVHFVNEDTRYQTPDTRNMRVRIRHGGEMVPAKLHNFQFSIFNSKAKVILEKPLFGVAAGQAAVFYQGEICLGGGTIV
jgi:tRNA-uridine 2-sulfurtransferase